MNLAELGPAADPHSLTPLLLPLAEVEEGRVTGQAFGSVLRGDFDEQSDVDVLVSYEGDHYLDRPTRLKAQDELSAILGRKVDWVNRLALSDEWAASWPPKPIREEILKPPR